MKMSRLSSFSRLVGLFGGSVASAIVGDFSAARRAQSASTRGDCASTGVVRLGCVAVASPCMFFFPRKMGAVADPCADLKCYIRFSLFVVATSASTTSTRLASFREKEDVKQRHLRPKMAPFFLNYEFRNTVTTKRRQSKDKLIYYNILMFWMNEPFHEVERVAVALQLNHLSCCSILRSQHLRDKETPVGGDTLYLCPYAT